VPRVEIDPPAPWALSPEQLRAVQRETDRLPSSRDRAIMELLLRTGLRIGELADLDAGDVRLTQRTGELVIRHGKGDRRRDLALVADVLGHADVKTTRRYARSELEDRRAALEALDH
jgi:site-specific recombinase XerD